MDEANYRRGTFHWPSGLMTIIAILIVMAFLAVSGYQPSAVMKGLGRAFTQDLAGTIRWATPLILAGMAVCIPFKAQVFNLGVDGQIYLGAIAANPGALRTTLSQDSY